jgi:signal transduction histidine kinase
MNIAEPACNDATVRSRPANAARTLLYLLTAIPLGTVGAALLLAGWIVVPVLAITPLVVPALVAFRAGVGGLARVEGAVANALLGTRTAPRARPPRAAGYWRRGAAVLGDGAFWRQQVFLLLRFVLGGAIAVAEVALLAGSLGNLSEPIWYRWASPNFGSWHVDTLGRALLFVPAGVLGLAAGLLLIRPLAALWRSVAAGLLGGDGPPLGDPPSPAAVAGRRRALATHAAAFATVNALAIVVWAATTAGRYFWPEWTLVPLAAVLAMHAWTELAVTMRMRSVAVHAGILASLAAMLVVIWAITGHGYFWPFWPLLGFALVLAAHAIVGVRAGGQAERIARLETTRAGAVDQQSADLRRIERDLHDGAQAQLVALGMSIGMAEQKLASDPAAAQALLEDARRSARDALEELRTLARGIHPPVLTDRGLGAAIATLADRTPLAVAADVAVDERPPDAVETAAYYVVAEALANAGKHAGAERVDIAVRRDGRELVVEIADDGRGGADPHGDGLRGLARRVEALDGTLTVTSPPGGPTIVRAVLPCAS